MDKDCFLSITLRIGLFALLVPQLSHAQATVGISPVGQIVLPGSAFTVNITVNNVVNLHLYHVVLRFDNTVMRCDAISRGGFFPGTFFLHLPPALPSDTARFATVDDALTGTQTRSGAGTFFSVQFTALMAGVSPVSLVEVVLRDGLNQNIAHTIVDGSVTVTSQTSTTMGVAAGWNLVSVPLLVPDYRKVNLYPTAISNAYRFENGYVASDTLDNGTGYWLKFPSIQDVTMLGIQIGIDTINVHAGWNMIGNVSDPVLSSGVVPVPPVVILSRFFGYRSSSGYFTADTLKPGGGYWVKVSESGQVIVGLGSRFASPLRR